MTEAELKALNTRQHAALTEQTETELTPVALHEFKAQLEAALRVAEHPDVTPGPWFETPYARTRLRTQGDAQVLVLSATRCNGDPEAADLANAANGQFVQMARVLMVPLLRTVLNTVMRLESNLLLRVVNGVTTQQYCRTSEYAQLLAIWLELKDRLPDFFFGKSDRLRAIAKR